MIQKRVWVSGRVQGVGFRASVAREASRYPGLKGSVRNLPDGRVEAVFCGDSETVLTLVEWCSRGPAGARVDQIQSHDESPDLSQRDFRVIR